jgi:septal ring factor EnvC (AmiA/AmiB activator)
MQKTISIVGILLIVILIMYVSNISLKTTYKKDIKNLERKSDSLSKDNNKLKISSDKLKKEINDISGKSLILDSIIKVQEKRIYGLLQEKNRLSKQRDSLKNDASKIINADSVTIDKYRSKYFGM